MATINADGATTMCPPVVEAIAPQNRRETCLLTDHDVKEVLGRKFRGGDFRLVDWRLEPLGETKGFLGRYYHLRVTARLAGRTENLRFFAKVPPPDGNVMLEYLRKSDAFNKEIAVYTDLIRRMDPVGWSRWSVECYLCKWNAIIVLEDASVNGYDTMDKYVPFDEDHCALLVRTLARFHSRSLILDERLRRHGDRTFLDLYGHLLNEVLFIEGDDKSKASLDSSVKAAYVVIDMIQELDERERISVKRRINEWVQQMPRLLAPSRKRRNVVCHRDVWANNLMFRHDASGKPRGCYIVDFQFFCYCPPAIDFALCLHLTTDRATRDRHFDSFAKLYHDTFAENLREEGLHVEDCFSWTAFRESYVELRNVGLIYACTTLPIMLLSTEAMVDRFHNANDELEEVMFGNERANLVRDQCRSVPAYRMRLSEIILEIKDRLPDRPPANL